MPGRARVLSNALSHRLYWFKTKIERVRLESPKRIHGHARMFNLFENYIEETEQAVADHLADIHTDPDDLVPKLRLLLTQFKAIHRAFDELFSRDSREVSQALSYFVNEACVRWSLPQVDIAITVGGPGNFVTRSTPFWASMFPNDPDGSREILSIAIPEHEGTMAKWVPIVLGHELAHHFLIHHQVPGLAEIESHIHDRLTELREQKADAETPESFANEWWTDEVTHSWIEELICDAYSVTLFGPAAVAAQLEFLTSLGDPTKPSNTHPPTCFRADLMMEWLGQDVQTDDQQVLAGLRTGLVDEPPSPSQPVELCEAMRSVSADIKEAVRRWTKMEPYDIAARQEKIAKLSGLLCRGIPGALTAGIDYDVIDVVNACWRAGSQETKYPTDRLASKALDDLYFVQSWQAAGGAVGTHTPSDTTEACLGVLTAANFLQRVNSGQDDQIAMTPLLPGALGPASIDLRLSNRFIVFEQTSNAAFDALQTQQDPRRMQSRVQKSWGDAFYLHPGQLVLAATLEYIVMPNDLCAQVVTRSSYGRLGLLSATAVQVHPGYKGCLTLELVNLGSMPIAITPGERVAQLMIFNVASPYIGGDAEGRKYNCPTGPEFSKIKQDPELGTLRNMRTHFDSSESPTSEPMEEGG